MATRSFIGKLLPNGSVTGVYCHYDGYPEGVGATLRESYRDASKVDALLALGDLSSLAPEIGEKHSFEGPTPGWTVAYHRDRGEELNPPKVYRSFSDLRKNVFDDIGAEYAYVYVDGGWEAVVSD